LKGKGGHVPSKEGRNREFDPTRRPSVPLKKKKKKVEFKVLAIEIGEGVWGGFGVVVGVVGLFGGGWLGCVGGVWGGWCCFFECGRSRPAVQTIAKRKVRTKGVPLLEN